MQTAPAASIQARRTEEQVYDPLLYNTPLPFQAEYFPMGHPIEIATNSDEVLSVAAGMWSSFPRLSGKPAVRLNIVVAPGELQRRPPPTLRGQGHLFSIVADNENYATADLKTGFASAWISSDVAADSGYLRYHFLEPLAYVLIASRFFTFVHASCIALEGSAVVLCGDSGSGKTCLAFECARKGWTFLSGDAVALLHSRDRDDHHVVGRPFEIRFRHTARRFFPELEAYPSIVRQNGKSDIEIDPQDLNVTCALQGTASHFVFLDRSEQSISSSIQPMTRAEARRKLEREICFGDESIRDEQRRTLERFLSLPALRLRYSELGSAESVLRLLVTGQA